MKLRTTWAPALLLSLGAIASMGAGTQRAMPLQTDLSQLLPVELMGMRGVDQRVTKEEERIAGMDDYLLRSYVAPAAAAATFSVYVGFYEKQTRGHSIHSPKNCMPGAGWEALTSSTTTVTTAAGSVAVTKYLLKRKQEQAVVLYWYQGRGRIEANEYRVKWNLLRDAAVRRRSDEALARVVVPVTTNEEAALATAKQVAARLIPALSKALPQ